MFVPTTRKRTFSYVPIICSIYASCPTSTIAFGLKSWRADTRLGSHRVGLTSSSQSHTATTLFAKTKKSNNNKKVKTKTINSSTGGFGKNIINETKTSKTTSGSGNTKAVTTNKNGSDYDMFPALDPQVITTLVPASADHETTISRSIEIYDRLDQIYGFPYFNHDQNLVDEENKNSMTEPKLSFRDLLSSTSSTTTKDHSIVSSTNSASTEFADLIAAATGEALDTSIDTLSATKQSVDDEAYAATEEMKAAIWNLPPFNDIRVLHVDPLVLAIDDFFTDEECDRYVEMSLSPDDNDKQLESYQTRSQTVGKDESSKSQRTSTTWFHHYKNVPELIAKASRLLGLNNIDQWEEPQTVRYRRNEKFTWHLDALAPAQSILELGGQRIATLLVYLKDLDDGGATMFRDLSDIDGTSPLKVYVII